jgi:hypothetical protein
MSEPEVSSSLWSEEVKSLPAGGMAVNYHIFHATLKTKMTGTFGRENL